MNRSKNILIRNFPINKLDKFRVRASVQIRTVFSDCACAHKTHGQKQVVFRCAEPKGRPLFAEMLRRKARKALSLAYLCKTNTAAL